MKKIISSVLLIALMLSICLGAMTGCKPKAYADFVMPEGGFDTSKPVTITFYHQMGAALQAILEDKRALERAVGYVIRGMSFPYGRYFSQTVQLAKACGMEYARIGTPTDLTTLPEDFICPLCKHGAADFEAIS